MVQSILAQEASVKGEINEGLSGRGRFFFFKEVKYDLALAGEYDLERQRRTLNESREKNLRLFASLLRDHLRVSRGPVAFGGLGHKDTCLTFV